MSGHLLRLPTQFRSVRSLVRTSLKVTVASVMAMTSALMPSFIVKPRLTGPGLHPACLTTLGAAVCRCRCRWCPSLDGWWTLAAGWPTVPLSVLPSLARWWPSWPLRQRALQALPCRALSLALLLAPSPMGVIGRLTPAGGYDGPWVGGVISPSFVRTPALTPWPPAKGKDKGALEPRSVAWARLC